MMIPPWGAADHWPNSRRRSVRWRENAGQGDYDLQDGHAFLLHEGQMPTDAAGNVIMDYLPAPCAGYVWPYSSNKDLKLIGVTASQRKCWWKRPL